MPGFLITNILNQDIELKNYSKRDCPEETIVNSEYLIKRKTLNKFLNDKLFLENEKFIVIIEGVVLNSQELIRDTNSLDFEAAIISMLENGNTLFFSKLKGSFSGAVFLKSKKEWLVYTNQTGEKQVFYYYEDGDLIIASQVNYILDILRAQGKAVSLDRQAVYSMITYMFVEGEHTYAKEIHRLTAGEYIRFSADTGVEVNKYYLLDRKKYDLSNISLEEIMQELERRMVNAVKKEFEKDDEYGYEHLADISGGFDCRMTTWIAHELGYKDVLNIHYSQNHCSDEVVVKKIGVELKNKLLTMSLSDISFVFDIERNTRMLYGLSMYCSSTGANNILDAIDMEQYGIEHTGMLGDAVIGTCLDGASKPEERTFRKVISNKVLNRLDKSHINKYEDTEFQILYSRGMNGALNSSAIRQNYTEIASPYLDVDVMEYCMCIPIKYRENRKLYNQWVINHHPRAAEIENAASGRKINEGRLSVLINKAKKVPRRLAQWLNLSISAQNEGMNPYLYWWNADFRFRKFIREYYEEKISSAFIPEEVRRDLKAVYGGDNVTTITEIYEKLSVVSVLAAIEYYFGEGK